MSTDLATLDRVPSRRFRAGLAMFCRLVRRTGRPIVVTRSGQDVVAVVPIGILRLARYAAEAMPDVESAAEGLVDPAHAAGALSRVQEGT